MKQDTSINVGSQVTSSLLFVLGVVFVILKFANVIQWDWWLVLTPFLIVPAFYLIVLAIGVIVWLSATLGMFIIDCVQYYTKGK